MPLKTNSTASNNGRLLLSVLLFIGLASSIGTALAALGCWSVSYDDFATFVLAQVNKPDWRVYFEKRVFAPSRYVLLPWLLLGSSGLAALLTLVGWQQRTALTQHLSALVDAYRQVWQRGWQTFAPGECRALLGLSLAFLVRACYYAHRYELQYDEAWTYNHFISNGLWVSLFSPNNNHILYSVLACSTDLLPIEAKYSLRLPVIIGGLSVVLSAAWWWRRSGTWGWTLVALAWLAFCPGVSLYSLYARGYIFQLLFTCWGLGLTLYLMRSTIASYQGAAWSAWSMSIILGLWSVPTHAYVAVVLSGILFFWSLTQRCLKAWFLANGLALGGAFLLYAPYFLTNGWSTLWAVASTEAPRGDAFIAYQDKVTDWLLLGAGRGTPVYGVLLLTVGLLGFGAWRRWRQKQAWSTPATLLLLLLLPTSLNALTGIQPPYRIWCFLSVPWAWSLKWLGEYYGGSWQGKRWTLGCLIIGLTVVQLWRLERHYALQWSAELDRQVKTVAQKLLEQQCSSIYLFTHYDKPLLECYYRKAQQPLKLYLAAPNSQHYAPFVPQQGYDAVLWEPASPSPDSLELQQLLLFYPKLSYSDQRIRLHIPLHASTPPTSESIHH